MWNLISAWRLARLKRRALPAVAEHERRFVEFDDETLRRESRSLGYRVKSGEAIEKLAAEAFALVREAARRTIGLRHYDVQVLGGFALLRRAVVEMQTGEGKTLTASLPAYLRALAGKGMHVATANDYLAARDAQTMSPVYRALGLTVGTVTADASPEQRRAAYRCDITYGTAKEFGFDFLRDRIAARKYREQGRGAASEFRGVGLDSVLLQRPAYAMLVDEADSILIDEAGTPLVIGGPQTAGRASEEACYRWSAEFCRNLRENSDYCTDERARDVVLTAEGRRIVREASKPRETSGVPLTLLYEFVERAVRVGRHYLRDRHYVVRDNPREQRPEVVIIDEFTGRPGEGRRWQDGVHEAIEAKERLAIRFTEGQAARVTVQDFFRRYPLLCGMTGTAATARREFRGIYETEVSQIPTHRPCHRKVWPTRVLGTTADKWRAIVDEVRELNAAGRPVLIGTRSIDKSLELSGLLSSAGLRHAVLNAYRIREEAAIVAEAGQKGRITVATNMAGRGTDIELGEGVAKLGGLHVVGTELHEAQRIDRQLAGRSARQGDPGSFRQFLALDDDLLREAFGEARAEKWRRLGARATGSLDGYAGVFRRAQRRLERRSFTARKLMLYREQERRKAFDEMGLDVCLDGND